MTASAADLALQTVIFSALTAASGVTNLLGAGAASVFDAVPDGAPLPFVVIGDNELTRGPLKGCERWQGKVTINVQTRQGEGPGTPLAPVVQAKEIMAQIEDVINDTLSPAGYVIVVLSVDFLGTDIDAADQKTVLSRLTFNIDMIEGS